jgi:hypothetical protein
LAPVDEALRHDRAEAGDAGDGAAVDVGGGLDAEGLEGGAAGGADPLDLRPLEAVAVEEAVELLLTEARLELVEAALPGGGETQIGGALLLELAELGLEVGGAGLGLPGLGQGGAGISFYGKAAIGTSPIPARSAAADAVALAVAVRLEAGRAEIAHRSAGGDRGSCPGIEAPGGLRRY